MKSTKNFTKEEIKEIRSRVSVSVERTGRFIRETRLQHHLSQTSLGSVLFVTKKAVSKWERGLCYPSMDVLPYLAETLGVTTDEILYAKFDNENKYEDSNKALKLIYKIFKNKHIKFTIKTCIAVVFVCLCIFFFENYNAVKIYTLWSDDKAIHLENAILTTTNQNEYLNIGYLYLDLPDVDNDSQINYTLYIGDENNIERIIQEFVAKDFMPHINNFNSDETPKIRIKDNFNKLYLNINYINTEGEIKEYNVKIKVSLKYQSNDIIHVFKNREVSITKNDNLLKLNEPQATEIDSDLSIDLSFLYDLSEKERKDKINSYNGKNIIVNGEEVKININKNQNLRIITDVISIYIDFKTQHIIIVNNTRKNIYYKENKIFFTTDQKELYLIILELINQIKQL